MPLVAARKLHILGLWQRLKAPYSCASGSSLIAPPYIVPLIAGSFLNGLARKSTTLAELSLANGKNLEDLTLAEFQNFSSLFGEDIRQAITVEKCVEARDSYGGTSPTQVAQAIGRIREELQRQQETLAEFAAKNL